LSSRHYKALLSAIAPVFVPCIVVGGVALGYWRANTTSAGATRSGVATVAEIVGYVAVVLGGFFAQAAGARAVTAASIGAPIDWRASTRSVGVQWNAVAGAALAIDVFATLGLVLFIVPGVLLWLAWFVAMPVTVMERVDARTALRRSASLVTGRRWTILGAFLLVELVVVACSVPFAALAAVVFAHHHHAQVIAEQLTGFVVSVLLTPVQVVLVVLVYLDLRAGHDQVSAVEVARYAGIAVARTKSPSAPRATPEPSEGRLQQPGGHQAFPRYPTPSTPETPSSPQTPSSTATSGAPEPGDPEAAPQPTWPAISPKPSAQSRPLESPAAWPAISPKPDPPHRRTDVRPAPHGEATTEPHREASREPGGSSAPSIE